MLELKCQHCGETFVAKHRDRRFCSNKCTQAAAYPKKREKILLAQRERRASAPEKARAKDKEYSKKYAERKRINAANWCKNNPDRAKANSTAWSENNRERKRELAIAAYNRKISANAIAHVANEIRKMKNDQPE